MAPTTGGVEGVPGGVQPEGWGGNGIEGVPCGVGTTSI